MRFTTAFVWVTLFSFHSTASFGNHLGEDDDSVTIDPTASTYGSGDVDIDQQETEFGKVVRLSGKDGSAKEESTDLKPGETKELLKADGLKGTSEDSSNSGWKYPCQENGNALTINVNGTPYQYDITSQGESVASDPSFQNATFSGGVSVQQAKATGETGSLFSAQAKKGGGAPVGALSRGEGTDVGYADTDKEASPKPGKKEAKIFGHIEHTGGGCQVVLNAGGGGGNK